MSGVVGSSGTNLPEVFYSYLEVAYFHVFIGSLSTRVVYTTLAYFGCCCFSIDVVNVHVT